MKKGLLCGFLLLLWTGSAFAVDVALHGDLNNRFTVYTNQAQFFNGGRADVNPGVENTLFEDDVEETWGEVKYRLWAEAATDDGKIKGVYGIELGALRFGQDTGDRGNDGAFSGDGVNIETRWAYTDFQLPMEGETRVRIGLIPFALNPFLWSETAMGVQLNRTVENSVWSLAWVRGREYFNNLPEDNLFEDIDALSARADFKTTEKGKAGFFVLWQRSDAEINDRSDFDPDDPDLSGYISLTPQTYLVKSLNAPVDLNLISLGADGTHPFATDFGDFFVNWDLIYQTGSLDNTVFITGPARDFDMSAWFAHADVGVQIGRARLTYTGWYASGDDDPNDGDFEAYLATDIDRTDSIILFEGGYTDDTYFTERPYLLDKGLIFNKLSMDYKFTDKLSSGGALLYLMTAEEIDLGVGSSDKIGTEVDAYVTYLLYPNLELSLNAGYLFADDALDAFEVGTQNGKSDTDIYRSTARVRYTF